MRSCKRFLPFLFACICAVTLCMSAAAAAGDTGFSDVAADAWYADAAVYVRDNGLMGGTSADTFSPDIPMTRAMLATVLYRMAGSPQVGMKADFRDVGAAAYYADAVSWASAGGLMGGYGDRLFGADDPITREQIAVLLWRYRESPEPAGTAADFADQAGISAYAVRAVAWARENGIVSGMDGNRFAPGDSATRAQVAAILYNFQQSTASAEMPESGKKVLVAYFSATGSTQNVAEKLAEILDADLYEIRPAEPYSAADLNYNSSNSRAEQENNNAAARPAISGSVSGMEDYDVVFIGYPIWWGRAPKIIYTFLEAYDFSGKTVVPFCTSGGSGIGGSLSAIQALAPDADWLDGQRFSGSADRSAIESFVNALPLPIGRQA